MAKRILITGVSGFIGSSLGEHFAAKGSHVIGLSRREILSSFPCENIKTNYEPVEIAQLVKRFDPDIIIHAAGSSSVGESIEDPSGDFSKSVALLQRLLEGVRTSGIRPRLVYPSSAAVYGDPSELPVREDAFLRPLSPYGYHKIICEKLAEQHALLYGIPVIIARLFSVFGPRQKRLLVWELFDQFVNKPMVFIEGTGQESRDYTYVNDLARLLDRLITVSDNRFIIVNIASGQTITVKALAYQIKEYLTSDKPLNFRGLVRPGDPLRWQADISLYEKLTATKVDLNFLPSLQECLDKWRW